MLSLINSPHLLHNEGYQITKRKRKSADLWTRRRRRRRRGDLDDEARENIIGIMDMRVFFHNKRVSTLIAYGVKSFSFSDHVYLITWPAVQHRQPVSSSSGGGAERITEILIISKSTGEHECYYCNRTVKGKRICYC